MKIWCTEDFAGDTCAVARRLLGQVICHQLPDGRCLRGRICETEAYDGFEDLASHAHRGKTPRNAVMFGPPGHVYLYLCYGIHWLLNVTTREAGYPAAVLIRGIDGALGPGKLTRALALDGGQNLLRLGPPGPVWVEAGPPVPASAVAALPRVGIDYAGPVWAAVPWRFRDVRAYASG